LTRQRPDTLSRGSAPLRASLARIVFFLVDAQRRPARLSYSRHVFPMTGWEERPWQSPRSIQPVNIIIRPPLITTPPRIIIKPPIHHDLGEHEDAKEHAEAAHEHSEQGHKHTRTVHEHSSNDLERTPSRFATISATRRQCAGVRPA
jgi:hypothetical protein